MEDALYFTRPALLALLPLLALWAIWRWRVRRRGRVAVAPLQLRTAPYRDEPRRAAALGLRLLTALVLPLEVLLLAVAVVGAAGPHGVERVHRVEDEGVDVMLVLDVSLSMLAEDFPPNRLAALRSLSADLIARAGGNRMGLVVFAGDAYVQSPLTTDRRVLRALLDDVGAHMLDQGAGGGTALGDALLVAAERLAAARVEGRGQAVVLITDGESNLGFDPLLAARHLAAAGVRLHAIGVGGTEPVEVYFEGERLGGDDAYLTVLDDRQLRAIAAAAGGRFFRATDVGTLEAVFDELARLESAPLEVRTVEVPRSYGPEVARAVLSLFAAHLFLAGMVARRPYR